MRKQLEEAIQHWRHVAPVVKYPQSEREFNQLTAELDELLVIVGNDETHQLMSLIDVISQLIAVYEENNHPAPKTTGIDALKFLMAEHGLRQSDLSEIASQGVLSEILHGKRQLNLRQIKLLAKRFHVDISTFIDD